MGIVWGGHLQVMLIYRRLRGARRKIQAVYSKEELLTQSEDIIRD